MGFHGRLLGSGLALGVVLAMLSSGTAASIPTAARTPYVTATGPTLVERAGTATLRVRVAKRARRAIRVKYRTIAASALPGRDYVAASGRVTIRKHKRQATIRLHIVNDSVHEGTEHFSVWLTSRSARFKNHNVVVTILDDDPAPPPPAGDRLSGTLTYHLQSDSYYADLELGSPGNRSEDSTFTMHVSLVQGTDGTWSDDGTGSWTFASSNKLWFRRGEGVDTTDNGYPFGCADNPLTFNFYKQVFWYDTDGSNKGPLVKPPNPSAVPDLHQAFLTLSGYHPDGSGTPVLRVVGHVRPDRYETRIPDAAHICDPDTTEQPNPIVHQGAGDPYLDAFATDSYDVWIPRSPDTGGLPASYDGGNLDFADSATTTTTSGFYNDETGHWSYEETDTYSVSGTLTRS